CCPPRDSAIANHRVCEPVARAVEEERARHPSQQKGTPALRLSRNGQKKRHESDPSERPQVEIWKREYEQRRRRDGKHNLHARRSTGAHAPSHSHPPSRNVRRVKLERFVHACEFNRRRVWSLESGVSESTRQKQFFDFDS